MTHERMLLIAAVLGSGCGGSVSASDGQLASGVGDAMASLDEAAAGSKLARLNLPFHSIPASLTPGIPERIEDLLLPRAYADSCWLEGFSACASGVETRTLSDCTIGPLALDGTVTLTWSNPTCVLAAAGDSVTRTGNFSISDYQGAALSITSAPGGQVLTDQGSSYAYKVLGIERVATTANGTKLFDITTSTTQDIGVSGVSRATRVVNGGTLLIEHNILHYGVSLTPNELAWSADCNCPVSGTLDGSLNGDASGSYSMELTGCGTAKITVGGKTESIQLDRCGEI